MKVIPLSATLLTLCLPTANAAEQPYTWGTPDQIYQADTSCPKTGPISTPCFLSPPDTYSPKSATIDKNTPVTLVPSSRNNYNEVWSEIDLTKGASGFGLGGIKLSPTGNDPCIVIVPKNGHTNVIGCKIDTLN
jgi:hypothetical protein